MQKRERMITPLFLVALMYGGLGKLVNDKRGEPGDAMSAKVIGVIIGLIFVLVGIFFYTVLSPVVAQQVVGSNTTAIALLPGGSGLVTLFKLIGTIFVIFGLVVFLGVLAALAIGAL